MARRITQETFDSAVQENIDEFEMTLEDAIADAVSQFEAQGVNLDAIVRGHSASASGAESGSAARSRHQVVEAVENLHRNKSATDAAFASLADESRVRLVNACTTLRVLCDSSLAERCLATESGAYTDLMDLINDSAKHSDWSLLVEALECLASLANGNPDILDDAGSDALVSLLKRPECTVPAALVLRTIRRCCVMHEANRQRFVAGGLIPLVAEAFTSSRQRSDREAVTQACGVYCALTLDDDVRVPFGKAHEHAKMIVSEADAIRTILELTADYVNDVAVLGELFATVGRLAVRDEFCLQVLQLGGVKNLLAALETNQTNQGLVRSLLNVLAVLCGSDPVKVEVARAGGAERVIDCMSTHARSAGVCEVGCAVIAAMVLRHPAHCAMVMECNAAECIARCLHLHASNAGVQKHASMAIRNLVSRCPENSALFLDMGVEPLLRAAMAMHCGECHDLAKAALRDLGCAVELKEQWTGTGRDLIHD